MEIWDWTFGIIVSRKRERAGSRSSKKLCKSQLLQTTLNESATTLSIRRNTFRWINITQGSSRHVNEIIAYCKYIHQHNPQCLTQHSPRRAYRPSSSVVLESRSTPSHLLLKVCPKRLSPSRTVPWSGTLWTGATAWELLVCSTWRIRYDLGQITN
jgi:hypothetical protein